MKTFWIILIFGLIAPLAHAQLELNPYVRAASGYSVVNLSDYQAIGVNPANIPVQDGHAVYFGLLDFSAGIYSEPLDRTHIFQDFLRSDYTFTEAEKLDARDRFTDSRMMGSAHINWLGLSYQHERLGAFAFQVSDHLHGNLCLNPFTADMLVMGYESDYFDEKVYDDQGNLIRGIATNPQKLSVLGEGSEANARWTREFALGYGKTLVQQEGWSLNTGITVKYVLGYFLAQYYSFNDAQELEGIVAHSPYFDMDLGEPVASPPPAGSGLAPVGSGVGLDFGLSATVKDRLRIGLSILDVGSVKWTGNVFYGPNVDFTDMDCEGIQSYNLIEEAGKLDAIIGFDWISHEPVTKPLPTALRFGGSYRIAKVFEAGAELYYPLVKQAPGGYDEPIVSAGGTLVLNSLTLSTGVSYNSCYGLNTPLAITLRFGDKVSYEVGIASRNMISLFRQDDPGPSLALGIFRMGLTP